MSIVNLNISVEMPTEKLAICLPKRNCMKKKIEVHHTCVKATYTPHFKGNLYMCLERNYTLNKSCEVLS